MSEKSRSVEVWHNTAAQRYEATVDGFVAECDYRREGDRLVLTHTYVPPEMRGRGIAEAMVRAALNDARAEGRKVVPACSYVATFIRRFPEYLPLVATDE